MSNRGLIEDKISLLRMYLEIVKQYQGYAQTEIENDVTLRGAIERYLYLIAQATIDLAEMVIALKQLRKPSTMSESFEILAEADLISSDLLEKMIKLVGFRNVITHDYVKVDYDIVYDILVRRLNDVVAFMDIAATM